MIDSSVEYKNQLVKDVKEIKSLFKKTAKISWRSVFKLERFLFISAFLIRKLIEANKLSDELEKENIILEYVDTKSGSVIDYFNITSEGSLAQYDLDGDRKVAKLKLKEFANLFIHSYLFVYSVKDLPIKDNTKKMELLINSDYSKNRVYFVTIYQFTNICKVVCKDSVVQFHWERKKSGKISIKKSRNLS